MKISKIHQAFSERLKNPDVLTNPEKYLGPNWEDVLNFWIYVDTLSDEEKKEIDERYWALDFIVKYSTNYVARDAAKVVVGKDLLAACCVMGWVVFRHATLELFVHHKLLEQNKTPLALKIILNNIITQSK
jgi:hypothetical protein